MCKNNSSRNRNISLDVAHFVQTELGCSDGFEKRGNPRAKLIMLHLEGHLKMRFGCKSVGFTGDFATAQVGAFERIGRPLKKLIFRFLRKC